MLKILDLYANEMDHYFFRPEKGIIKISDGYYNNIANVSILNSNIFHLGQKCDALIELSTCTCFINVYYTGILVGHLGHFIREADC